MVRQILRHLFLKDVWHTERRDHILRISLPVKLLIQISLRDIGVMVTFLPVIE
jgi:hypothetical protein